MKISCGILLYNFSELELKVFLVHPGGPFWKNKDEGAWSIPKGERNANEDPLTAAIREFKEETELEVGGDFIALHPIKQKSGKEVMAFAVEGQFDPTTLQSNEFEMEWPPKSGITRKFPEVDRGAWFTINEAAKKINPAQFDFILQLQKKFLN